MFLLILQDALIILVLLIKLRSPRLRNDCCKIMIRWVVFNLCTRPTIATFGFSSGIGILLLRGLEVVARILS